MLVYISKYCSAGYLYRCLICTKGQGGVHMHQVVLILQVALRTLIQNGCSVSSVGTTRGILPASLQCVIYSCWGTETYQQLHDHVPCQKLIMFWP